MAGWRKWRRKNRRQKIYWAAQWPSARPYSGAWRGGPLVHSSGPETGSQKELGHCSRHRHPGHQPSRDDKDDVLCRYFYSCAKYFSMVAYHESGLGSCSIARLLLEKESSGRPAQDTWHRLFLLVLAWHRFTFPTLGISFIHKNFAWAFMIHSFSS